MDGRTHNRGKKGNKGGGSHSVKDSIWHKNKWEKDTEVRQLEEKIATGVYSIRDMYCLRALKADTVVLKNIADKVLANLVDIRGKDGSNLNMAVVDFTKLSEE